MGSDSIPSSVQVQQGSVTDTGNEPRRPVKLPNLPQAGATSDHLSCASQINTAKDFTTRILTSEPTQPQSRVDALHLELAEPLALLGVRDNNLGQRAEPITPPHTPPPGLVGVGSMFPPPGNGYQPAPMTLEISTTSANDAGSDTAH